MTPRQENLETIRAAAIKANPEIVELKFGCHITTRRSGTRLVFAEHDGNANEYGLCYYPRLGGGTQHIRLEGVGIIGRPIRLADVLFAIDRRRPLKQRWAVRYDGLFFDERNNKWGGVWSVRADTLEEQSDECIAFLADLLRERNQNA